MKIRVVNIKPVYILLLLSSLFFTQKTLAITPKELLIKQDNRLKSLKSYSVEVVENGKIIGPRGLEESSSLTKTFVKGKKRYTETTIYKNRSLGSDTGEVKSQNQQTIDNHIVQIFDGVVSWFYNSDKKEVKKVEFSRLPAKIQEKIKASQDSTDLDLPEGLEFTVEEKKEGKKKFFLLTSQNTITLSNQKYDKIVLWIDSKEYVPAKAEWHGKMIITVPQGPDLEIQTHRLQEFKNWEFDPDIPDSKFVFTVPEGVKVKDVTEETGGIYERYMKDR